MVGNVFYVTIGQGEGGIMATPEQRCTLVIEKVMGYTRHTRVGWKSPTGEIIWDSQFNPLESWADAGRVYDSLIARGWIVTTETNKIGEVACIITDGETYRELAKVRGRKDWKEAICLAALAALGVEVE